MAQHMLDRWRWQLAGHMHVLTAPTYMEDHLAAVEEEIAGGLVPLPQLPKHKQVMLLVGQCAQFICVLAMMLQCMSQDTQTFVSLQLLRGASVRNADMCQPVLTVVWPLFLCRRRC